MKTILPFTEMYTDPPPKTLIIGSNGYLGKALFKLYLNYYPDLFGTAHKDLDHQTLYVNLLNPSLKKFKSELKEYTYAIICSGVSSLLGCEEQPKKTYRVNVLGVLELIKQLLELGIKPIIMSTDIVFDGTKDLYLDDSPTNPLNQYGIQKAELEERIPKLCGNNYLILRLSKIIDLSPIHKSLFSRIVSDLKSKEPRELPSNFFFSPLILDDLIDIIRYLQYKNANGLFNLCGPDLLTWYDLYFKIATHLGISFDHINKIKIDFSKLKFNRPKVVKLEPKKLKMLYPQFNFTSIDQALKKFAKTLCSR